MCASFKNCPYCKALVFTKDKKFKCNLCGTIFTIADENSRTRAVRERYYNWVVLSKEARTRSCWDGISELVSESGSIRDPWYFGNLSDLEYPPNRVGSNELVFSWIVKRCVRALAIFRFTGRARLQAFFEAKFIFSIAFLRASCINVRFIMNISLFTEHMPPPVSWLAILPAPDGTDYGAHHQHDLF